MNNGCNHLLRLSSTDSQSNSPGIDQSCPQKSFLLDVTLSHTYFLIAQAFVLEHAQPSQTCTLSVTLTSRALYVVRNNFYPRCEYICTTLMSVSLDMPNFLCHSSFSSLISILFFGRLAIASCPYGAYLLAFK